MALNCGASFVKYLLCFFNFLLIILGAALMVVSTWVAIDNTSFFLLTRIAENPNLESYSYTTIVETVAYIFICTGGIIFILGFLGCCGAAMESKVILSLYGVLIALIFLLQVTAGILFAIYKDDVDDHVESMLVDSIHHHYTKYDKPNTFTVAWNNIMVKMNCCGVRNYTDFNWAVRWQRENETGHLVPWACCIREETSDDLEFQDEMDMQESSLGVLDYPLVDESCLYDPKENNSYYHMGCHGKLKEWAERHMVLMCGIAGAVGLVEIIIVFLAFCLCAYTGYRDPK